MRVVAEFQSGTANQVINHSRGKRPSKNRLMRSRVNQVQSTVVSVFHRTMKQSKTGSAIATSGAINCGRACARLSLNEAITIVHRTCYSSINVVNQSTFELNCHFNVFYETTNLIKCTYESLVCWFRRVELEKLRRSSHYR